MRIYTVHEPPDDEERPTELERFKFVREGFYFWAFLTPPLWLLRHRLWFSFLGYLAIAVGLVVLARYLGAGSTLPWVFLAFHILIGNEAGTLLRWKWSRRGYDLVAAVTGPDLEAAERRFYDNWLSDGAPRSQRATGGRADDNAGGWFGEPGWRT